MEYFVGGLIVVLVCWFFLWLADKAMDGSNIAKVLVVIMLAALIGGFLHQSELEADAGPCLKYEESFIMVNNVMTPYRYCVERGEWTE